MIADDMMSFIKDIIVFGLEFLFSLLLLYGLSSEILNGLFFHY